jgi:heterodisulfide reductase subunit C2
MTVAFSKESMSLAKDLQRMTGENVMLCYQCRKCTLGCPTAYTMKMRPHEMVRAIQLGLTQEIYWSGTIWMCLSCEACNTRCPQGINILHVIDGLRVLSKEVEHYNSQPAIPAMHRIFLSLVERFGRAYELGLALLINLRMLTPFKDIDMASSLFLKGKLRPLPRKSPGVKKLRKVIKRIEALEKRAGASLP